MTTYTLRSPVTVAGKTTTELTFRKPRTGDMMVLDKFEGEMSRTIALLATISDTTMQVFKEIEFDDFIGISEAVGDILGKSPASMVNGSTS